MDLSCDYLIDITGLTDVPKEVYSCARQDGACENKNCPAAKNFEKKSSDYQTTIAENPSATIDYDSLTRGKLCPIFAAGLVIAGHTRADEHLARCGPRCAWYDQTTDRCAVLSLSRNK